MVQSRGLIKGYSDKGKLEDETGLKLLAPSGSATDDLDVNFIGIKAPRLIVLLDELTDLPMGVLNSCLTNLEGGKQISFELKAASNPNLYTDAFGVLSKPKKGWNSVSSEDRRWETERGLCIRFDSEKSPNMLLGYEKYPWLPDPQSIAAAKRDFGADSRFFWRMYKAMWLKDAADETIYSEGELIQAECDTMIVDAEYGVHDGDVIYLAGEGTVCIDEEDPYTVRRIYQAAWVEDGHLNDQKGLFLIDPARLAFLPPEVEHQLMATLEEDFAPPEGEEDDTSEPEVLN